MSQLKDFESPDITGTLLKYSLPSLVTATVQALYNIVDRIYIGKGLGTDALAGVSLTFPVFILSIAIGVLFGQGNAAVISLKLGEKKKEEAEKTLGTTYFLYCLLGGLVALAGGLFLEPILTLFGASEVTMPYARTYLGVYLPFMAVDFLALGTNGGLRSEGNPRLAMMIAVSGCLLNMILDPIFLFLFHWGVAGVAWATVISRIVTAAAVMGHFVWGKGRYLTLRWQNIRPNAALIRQMTAIGLSPFLFNLATAFVGIFNNRMLVRYGGDRALGVLGAVTSVYMVFQTPIRGVQFGSQPLLGYNYGAGNYSRVSRILGTTLLLAELISLIGLLCVLFGADFLIGLFSKGDPALIEMGKRGMRIYMSMLPMMVF
ncbi:MAG: MATE family efflux transporter, partial [Spirochaetales bacterium]|nr:MATE family efflux transporter [Spirochaetales bacterium]